MWEESKMSLTSRINDHRSTIKRGQSLINIHFHQPNQFEVDMRTFVTEHPSEKRRRAILDEGVWHYQVVRF